MGMEKLALEIAETYRGLRLQGLKEPHALEALERNDRLLALWNENDGGTLGPEGFLDGATLALAKVGLLDEYPVGWREEEAAQLAEHMDFKDVLYWVSRIIDAPHEDLVVGILLAAQGHLSKLLTAIGPAIHLIPENPGISAGKSRCAEALTFLGGGRWYASATIAYLKSARDEAPIVLGIDEGDEAEKDNPGIKAYLLACHDWHASFGKYGEPDVKGKRAPQEIAYGGPVFITFRKKPWPALASRAIVFQMKAARDARFSDDGHGEGFVRLLRPAAAWLRKRCEAAIADRDSTWALIRTGEPDFKAKLDRVSEGSPLLRQRDNARNLLFIAELLGVDLEKEIRKKAVEEVELESENATIIEAIEADLLYQEAKATGFELEVESLRLRIQKTLRDSREFIDLSRNRFAAVLEEMGYSKAKGPTWKKITREGRKFMVIFPGLLPTPPAKGESSGSSASVLPMENGPTRPTGPTLGGEGSP